MKPMKIIAATICIILTVAAVPTASEATYARSETQDIHFPVDVDNGAFQTNAGVRAIWNTEMNAYKGDPANIPVTLEPLPCSLTLIVKLSQIPLLGLTDQTVVLPFGQTLIGAHSISILQYLTNIPSSVAGLILDVHVAVSPYNARLQTGSSVSNIGTAGNEWTSWGTRTIAIDASREDRTLQFSLQYGISLGLTASVGPFKYKLIDQQAVLPVASPIVMSTHVLPSENWGVFALLAGAGAILAGSVVAVPMVRDALDERRSATKKAPIQPTIEHPMVRVAVPPPPFYGPPDFLSSVNRDIQEFSDSLRDNVRCPRCGFVERKWHNYCGYCGLRLR